MACTRRLNLMVLVVVTAQMIGVGSPLLLHQSANTISQYCNQNPYNLQCMQLTHELISSVLNAKESMQTIDIHNSHTDQRRPGTNELPHNLPSSNHRVNPHIPSRSNTNQGESTNNVRGYSQTRTNQNNTQQYSNTRTINSNTQQYSLSRTNPGNTQHTSTRHNQAYQQRTHSRCHPYSFIPDDISRCPLYNRNQPIPLQHHAPCPPPWNHGQIDKEIVKDVLLEIQTNQGCRGCGGYYKDKKCKSSRVMALFQLEYLEKFLGNATYLERRIGMLERIIEQMEKRLESLPSTAPAGVTGPQGPTGRKGQRGHIGSPGRCLGTSFDDVDEGAPGPRGPKGMPGPEGDKMCGCNGARGGPGEDGPDGVGVVGDKGPKGEDGKDGLNRYFYKGSVVQ